MLQAVAWAMGLKQDDVDLLQLIATNHPFAEGISDRRDSASLGL